METLDPVVNEWLTEEWAEGYAESTSYAQIRKLYARSGVMSPYELYLADLLRKENAPSFIPQVRIDEFVVDMFVPAAQTVFEVDGFFHDLPEKKAKDRREDLFVQSLGFTLLRVRTEELEADGPGIARTLARILKRRAAFFEECREGWRWENDGRRSHNRQRRAVSAAQQVNRP